jgi:hypothetical protein
VAIRWSGAEGRQSLAPAGSLRLTGCSISGVAAAVECHRATPLAIDIGDTLHLGPGPLVSLRHAPRIDEPLAITLDRATLRGVRAAIELRASGAAEESGSIAVAASACAFAPADGGSLLLVTGDGDPRRWLRRIEWSGKGSLLAAGAAVAASERDGKTELLENADVSIDGLVAGPIEFAGPAGADPATSRIVRWQAPLESADPPGIDGAPPRLPALDSPRP